MNLDARLLDLQRKLALIHELQRSLGDHPDSATEIARIAAHCHEFSNELQVLSLKREVSTLDFYRNLRVSAA